MIHHKAFSNAPTPTQDWSIQTLSRDSILILKCHQTLVFNQMGALTDPLEGGGLKSLAAAYTGPYPSPNFYFREIRYPLSE